MFAVDHAATALLLVAAQIVVTPVLTGMLSRRPGYRVLIERTRAVTTGRAALS